MTQKRSWIKNFSRRKKILYFGLLLLVAFFTWFIIRLVTIDTNLTAVSLYELPELVSLKQISDSEKVAVAIDGNLAVANSNQKLPTASTAKMILGLAIMKAKPFNLGESGESIPINQADYDSYIWYYQNNGTTTAVRVGEEISEYDALMSVFLASSNNMADTLAKWAFGSQDAYREYATNMLLEWGINDTVIGDDASGFLDTTKSSAANLAVIGAKVLENPVLAEIVGTKTYTVPVAGTINNTNKLLGTNNIIGIKTGYIGEVSGYCLVSGYKAGEHNVTVSLLGAPTRAESFEQNLSIVTKLQEIVVPTKLVTENQIVGYLESWWIGRVPIRATTNLEVIAYSEANITHELNKDEKQLFITINNITYPVSVMADEYNEKPSFIEKVKHIFGWEKEKNEIIIEDNLEPQTKEKPEKVAEPESEKLQKETSKKEDSSSKPFTNAKSANCTIGFGALMLINPNFTVESNFINTRRGELISLSSRYGIVEGNPYNGDNLLDYEAAPHLNNMINAYKADYPGHTIETRSCFRSKGTQCGRLCAATGASDHHTGLTCDLLDPAYGTSLDTDYLNQHIEWQWLKKNSYKYGFIDRFPEAWAGGPMSEPLNVDANGSTGLYETWHYRYVGIEAATEIATGKYNNGQYDSLEHYLKAKGMIKDLKAGKCDV